MTKKLPVLFFFVLLAAKTTLAQTGSITAHVKNENGKPLPGVTCTLTNTCNNTNSSGITDTTGTVTIAAGGCAPFRIMASLHGHDTFRAFISEAQLQQGSIEVVMKKHSDTMDEISIQVQAGVVTVKGDKIIVDANRIMPGAAATVLDLLQRCPGVVVDEQHSSIQLKGRSGVMLMVDGRLQPLAGEDLFNWLKNTPAIAVDKIELISNPSARYDASGTAGMINLLMKRNKQQGLSGSLSSAAGQGRYGKLNEGAMLNYKRGKVSFFSQYNYALRKGFNELNLQRDFYSSDTFIGSYVQRNYLRFPVHNHTLRTGLDIAPDKTLAYGFSLNANASLYDPNGKNYSNVLGSNRQIASYFSTVNNSDETHANGGLNAYIKKNTDTLGSNITADLDLAEFINLTDQLFTTEYFDQNYQKNAADYLLKGNLNGSLKIAAIKCDLHKNFTNGSALETGIKASRVIADNDVQFSDVSNAMVKKDSGKSNHFIYSESIAAAYVQFSGALKQWQYQTGLRYEHTLARGLQKITNESFLKNYGNWFPSFTLQRVLKNGSVAGISLSRRLQRPQYGELNPFKFYLDPSTYKSGNPNLNPEFSWIGELSLASAKGAFASLSLSHTDHIITEVLYPSETEPKTTIQTNKNLNQFESMILTVSAPLNFGKKSSGLWSANAGYQYFTGSIAGTPLHQGSFVVLFSGMQSLKLNQNWSADMNASFQSGQVYAYMYLHALGQLGFGLQRSLMQKKAVIKLNLTDVFFTGNPRGETEYKGYTEHFTVKRDTRVAMLSFTYRFGGPQTPQRRRQGGAEEENRRAQNQVG